MEVLSGSCLCGHIGYELSIRPKDVGYCHCRICQKSSGAPVMVWATVPKETFRLGRGELAYHRSTPMGTRSFCPQCGTPMTLEFVQPDAKTLDVNVVTLDQPQSVVPRYHIWTDSQIPWFDTKDALPRYRDHGPDVYPEGAFEMTL